MKSIRQVGLVSILSFLVLAPSFAADISFKIKINGGKSNATWIDVTNFGADPITKVELVERDPDDTFWANADTQRGVSPPYGGSVENATPVTTQTSTLTYNLTGFDKNETFSFVMDISGGVEDYRYVLFNNGSGGSQNAYLKVTTDNGDTRTFIFPDGAHRNGYTFYSEPRTLTVTSSAGDNAIYVPNCTVRVNGIEKRTNLGAEDSFPLYLGAEVEIVVPRYVYQKADGTFLMTDATFVQDQLDEAQQRFEAIGISVNDVPQSGDPILYRFTITEDANVVAKWRQDFALRVESDVTKTESTLVDEAGNPWLPEQKSQALGNPEYSAQLHWIPKDENVIATIDGQVFDFTHPGLDVRFVPKGYNAYGSADLWSSVASLDTPHYRNWNVGQAPPAKQQVDQFPMIGPAMIEYIWQNQYGVKVNIDDAKRGDLPLVQAGSGSAVETFVGEGVYWFDPGTEVKVLCRIADSSEKALAGWLNGDGYYFNAAGDVSPIDGSYDGPADHATWLDPFDVEIVGDKFTNTYAYAGMDISNLNGGIGLQRPVRLLWNFGNKAIAVTVPIGEHVLQTPVSNIHGYFTGETFAYEPTLTAKIGTDNPELAVADMLVWDEEAARLYPVAPGTTRVTWSNELDSIDVLVTAVYPSSPHYRHVAGTPPVNLEPDPTDSFVFKELKHTDNQASVDGDNTFSTEQQGWSVLLFSEFQQQSRGNPREFVRVRTVKTETWLDAKMGDGVAIVGRQILDPELDLAELDTGYVLFDKARYNPLLYNRETWAGLSVTEVYDMELLRSNAQQRKVIYRNRLAGPIIPVNLHPGAQDNERIVVAWYDDPTKNDNLLWPYATRTYLPKWPTSEADGLGRIVIASQFGSDSLNSSHLDQVTVPAVTNFSVDVDGNSVTNVYPAEHSLNPSRLQQVAIYNQPDPNAAGYNPNEEHGLLAPSLRYANVSPRPPAAYALRNNDLNRHNASVIPYTEVGQPLDYTSDPYVLVQFFDTADETYKMRVYSIQREDTSNEEYMFANAGVWSSTPTASALYGEPHVVMKAGEPVIPFYPLVDVIGAAVPPETYGDNITAQLTYWEDHKGTSWSVSGGTDAWFTQFPYYPLLPDFWWPENEPGRLLASEGSDTRAAVPNVGDNLAFLPSSLSNLRNLNSGDVVSGSIISAAQPTEILYKSDWPDVAPLLKAGETLTFSGGEYRADHPTSLRLDANDEIETIETPGLPGILAFATAEVVFDSLNPTGDNALLQSQWTARVGQVLEKRVVELSTIDFPATLSPASGNTRISQGKYVFKALPASLQNRVRYDPIAQQLEISGLLNDKDIADATLTASPPAVYVLEPNILTITDATALRALDESTAWLDAVQALYELTRNPDQLQDGSGNPIDDEYLVGLQRQIVRNPITGEPVMDFLGGDTNSTVFIARRNDKIAESMRGYGPGLALVPNANFLDPAAEVPDVSWVTVVENNDPSLGGSPITPHIIQVDRRERYRGSVKTVLSDNVFDENVVVRHTGDFGANADDLYVEWWYRPDDGSLNVPPPDSIPAGTVNPWKVYPDTSGAQGRGRYETTLKGNPNAPEALLADTWWFARYRHKNDTVNGTDWAVAQIDGKDTVNFTWAGAGNSDPLGVYNAGIPDYKAQLVMGWIKRVLDAVNPYEARIRDFEGDSPSTVASMLQEFGARFEGPVALNPDKNVIENVGLIELYETILKRGRDLSIDLSRPISTPAIANALQLASTRISDFYNLLAREAYSDALNPTVGFGSDSVEYGALAPAVFTFQNQLSTPIEEELALLRGVDDNFARPVYNRLFWNFTKGEGEAAYALNYNISDINTDGFIDEDDAMILFPQGHGDAWGHYLTALRNQYELFNHPYFNWVSRSEFYNLMDIVIKVDFLDERKFAQTAAAKAKAAAEIVDLTYREKYVMDPTAQWQGYTDSDVNRAWGVQGWARRTAQGAYFDWVMANALLPSTHPNETLEGIQKVDRKSNSDLSVISANLNKIQRTFDHANSGFSPLGLDKDVMAFDLDPIEKRGGGSPAVSHFNQLYSRAVLALNNAKTTWDHANQANNMIRKVGNTEASFRNDVYQEDLTYKNRLIKIFGRPYNGTIGSGKLYPAGYDGPDLALHMYIGVREINNETVPGPAAGFAAFDASGNLNGGDMYSAFETDGYGKRLLSLDTSWRTLYAPSIAGNPSNAEKAIDGLYDVRYTDLVSPKVGLESLTDLMPVTTAGYSFQAPEQWGDRLAYGELQTTLNQMLVQEAKIAQAIAAWDGLTGEIIRTLRIIDARIDLGARTSTKNKEFANRKLAIENTIKGLETASTFIQALTATTTKFSKAAAEMVPKHLPTAGFSFSPGDALSPAKGATWLVEASAFTGFTAADAILAAAKAASEIYLSEEELDLAQWNGSESGKLQKKEWLKEVEDLLGDEPILRVGVFKEIEALRQLGYRYVTLVDEGARLVDERAAYNKRVAAKTQLNRYQDMNFRVARNHALQTYRSSFDLAARYAYLAARAYDYETNFDPSDAASPVSLYEDIVKARGIGLVQNGPQLGGGGLAASLASLKANYDVVSSQIGITNPQVETGKISLRTELFRILPKGSVQPVGDINFPSPAGDSDALWKETLAKAKVEDLWSVPEFRQYCRPFDAALDENGDHIAQPGIVIPFSTDIHSGNNVFGNLLSGGDHAYDPSVFANKIYSAGIWFTDYLSGDVLNDLPEAPRVYLVPTGLDVMSVPTSENPNVVREWNIVDQRIPAPVPATGSELDSSNWIPLNDSLNGKYGEQRRFSSFRAYHDSGDLVDMDELVTDTRLFGRSVWNTQWMLIIPGATLNADPDEGLSRFIQQISDIKLVFETYGISGN